METGEIACENDPNVMSKSATTQKEDKQCANQGGAEYCLSC